MAHRRWLWLMPLFLALLAGAAVAQPGMPVLIYDAGGKRDGGFNEAAFKGAERFRAETGAPFREHELAMAGDRGEALARFAREGSNPVIVAGFAFAADLERVARVFPQTRFVIIDAVVPGANVQSIVFREQEGAYLAGILAAMASSTGTIGFIGGVDIPPIQRFNCGYVRGARSARADIRILRDTVGTDTTAWDDPAAGARLARRQMDSGADVLFAAAGATGTAVLRAAAEAGRLGIGVDSNQNHLFPGRVLTSVLKRVDNAVHHALTTHSAGTWQAGVRTLGLREDGVGYALDSRNRSLVSPAMEAAMDAARAELAAGRVSIPDPGATGVCR